MVWTHHSDTRTHMYIYIYIFPHNHKYMNEMESGIPSYRCRQLEIQGPSFLQVSDRRVVMPWTISVAFRHERPQPTFMRIQPQAFSCVFFCSYATHCNTLFGFYAACNKTNCFWFLNTTHKHRLCFVGSNVKHCKTICFSKFLCETLQNQWFSTQRLHLGVLTWAVHYYPGW